MKGPKINTDDGGAAAAAAAAQAAAAKAAAEAQAAATNLQKNFAADLKTENLGQVVAGGGAEAASEGAPSTLRRKKQGTALSSQLGINV